MYGVLKGDTSVIFETGRCSMHGYLVSHYEKTLLFQKTLHITFITYESMEVISLYHKILKGFLFVFCSKMT